MRAILDEGAKNLRLFLNLIAGGREAGAYLAQHCDPAYTEIRA
jgi:hypothetical protein